MTIPAAGRLAVFDRPPPQLAEAMAQKNLVVFCGAGISMAPPAAVPSCAGFNEVLFRRSWPIGCGPGGVPYGSWADDFVIE
jgi:hypothetical protein